MYLCWMIPVQIAFELDSNKIGLSEVHSVLDAWFVVDIVLNFRTGYISYGELRMNPKDVAQVRVHGLK